ELSKSGDQLNYQYLGQMLGIPFVPTTANKGIGIHHVIDTIIDVYEEKKGLTKHIHINYGNTIETAITKIKQVLNVNSAVIDAYASRYLAIKLIENEKSINALLQKETVNFSMIEQVAEKQRKIITDEYHEDTETVITNAKYGFIRGALKETYIPATTKAVDRATKIDNLLTNKWLGFPILLVFLWIMFQTTFTLGAYPQTWIEMGVDALSNWMTQLLPQGLLNDFLVNGIIAGVGGVIVFLPNILILFFFISLMEDTGYMARATFILDKMMHRIGLHGRSFIPLLTGFGCSVPAIMATRTLENKKDRILTMLIIPFMSCSAKLPVYLLLVSAFFTQYQGLILLSIYIIGIIVGILVAILLKNTAFKKESEQFVMELPPYRKATLRNTGMHMWNKSAEYLKKMGTVILIASAIIWALSYFPQHNIKTQEIDHQITQCQLNNNLTDLQKSDSLAHLSQLKHATQQEYSYIGRLGKIIEPVLRPLGFDWKMSVCILTGFAAKETVVSSMSILYHNNSSNDDENSALIQALRSEKYSSGNAPDN
ncbi:MAG: ferrous iron transport protein B, partial [Bacteroidales bacterium]|nr:ferrous iron transport protein B [Bacteroidales bacterium]